MSSATQAVTASETVNAAPSGHISMTLDAISRCPHQVRERVRALCDRELSRQAAAVSQNMRRFGPTIAMHSAQLATGGFASGIASMPWHCVKSAMDWKEVDRALQHSNAPDQALTSCFKAIKPMNTFIAAMPGESRSAYLARAEGVIHDLRIENVVFDAAIIDPLDQNSAIAFAAKFGISARYVWIATAQKAPDLSVMRENALIHRHESSRPKEPILPPSAAVTRRIATLKKA